MNFSVMQYYCTVCDTGSFAKAAEQICISRQALSKSMLALEDEVGMKLFIRKKQGLEMTSAGNILYQHSRVLLQDWMKATKELEMLRSSSRQCLRIGYAQLTYNLWDAGHVEAFMEAHPETDIRYEIARPAQLTEKLKNGELDLVVSSECNCGENTFRVLLQNLPFHIILCRDDPLARKDAIDIADLGDRTLFLRPITGLYEREQEAFRQVGIYAAPLPTPSLDPLTILRTIRDTNGIYLDSKLHILYRNVMDGLKAIPFVYEGPLRLDRDRILVTARKEQRENPVLLEYIQYLSNL